MLFDQWLRGRLYQTKRAGLYRTMRTMHTAPGSSVIINGQQKLVFSSNDYAGLANHKKLIDASKEVLNECGCGSSGSRLITGNTAWHERLEDKLAAFKKTEAALLFSSGYLANIGVLSSIPEKGDVLLSDALNHASIIDGCRLSSAETVIYNHIDMDDLEEKLKETQSYRRRFIVTDGVFSMDGTIAPLDQMMKLAKRYQAFVIVDDAHATGVLGENGRGTSEYFHVVPDVMMGTLSKALGSEGGFVAGSQELIEFLLNHARTFIFQTALPPANCAASVAAIDLIETQTERRKKLLSHVKEIKSCLSHMGYTVIGDHTPIIPVIIGDAQDAVVFADELMEKGIYAPAIRPPTVAPKESRIRLTVTANHHWSDIHYLIDCFRRIGKELNVIS
ncbi:8-amino-7-oxononanoate synthase [Alteribacillus persepolensis]|uniref:8-amino-7-ketopelargonate synthase n=1 Tax=Alteribacillus persepolensis TaxID=568899 RepID=A0A1G8FYI2_9BACI|nr:8-amino-7-oxononanoate synthase [Alteribacillus persepolensis]SDH87183.1 8-amino-7-oxononanoate synthase [Alteribacillus persepolensis]